MIVGLYGVMDGELYDIINADRPFIEPFFFLFGNGVVFHKLPKSMNMGMAS